MLKDSVPSAFTIKFLLFIFHLVTRPFSIITDHSIFTLNEFRVFFLFNSHCEMINLDIREIINFSFWGIRKFG